MTGWKSPGLSDGGAKEAGTRRFSPDGAFAPNGGSPSRHGPDRDARGPRRDPTRRPKSDEDPVRARREGNVPTSAHEHAEGWRRIGIDLHDHAAGGASQA